MPRTTLRFVLTVSTFTRLLMKIFVYVFFLTFFFRYSNCRRLIESRLIEPFANWTRTGGPDLNVRHKKSICRSRYAG